VAKYLLLALVVYLIIRFLRVPRKPPPAPPPAMDEHAMVRCAHCGIHLPSSEAVLGGDESYCCDAHRLRGPQGKA